MKSLVNYCLLLKFKHLRINFRVLLILACSFVTPAAIFSQTAELEIIGKRNQPFTIMVGNTMVSVEPAFRSVVNLGDQPVPITITFRDPALGSLTDTIVPSMGNRLVYRIAEDDVHKVLISGAFFARIKALFTGVDAPVQSGNQPTFSLKFLEKLPVSESIKTEVEITKNSQDTNSPSIRISSAYQFSRDSMQRINRTDTLIVTNQQVTPAMAKDSATTVTNAQPPVRVLTQQQQQLVVSTLSSQKFEEDKVQYLQRALKDVSLTTEQLTAILRQLDFERSKLQICKQYYPQISDKENSELLYSVFDFDSTKQELKKWINDQPR
jgi:hypothetical protein